MSESAIEWTDYTLNPWIGCQRVDPGCRECYADGLAGRFAVNLERAGWELVGDDALAQGALWKAGGPRLFAPAKYLDAPLDWQRKAARAGETRRVFCAAMADIFEVHGRLSVRVRQYQARTQVFELVARTPSLTWLFLTKRLENVRVATPVQWRHGFPPNSMLGVSISLPELAEARLAELARLPARRFVSLEPLLGPVRLGPWVEHLHWVIVGGESGANARSMEESWVRDIRDECMQAGVPFFYKQRREGKRMVSLPVLDGQAWAGLPCPGGGS